MRAVVQVQADSRTTRAWEVLATVLDPEVPALSLCDLGIVRDVQARGDELEVVLTPTYSGCPATELIERNVLEAIDAAGLGPAYVTMQRAPAWTTDWISEEGRRKLREYGIAPPGPVAAGAAVPVRFIGRRARERAQSPARIAAAAPPSACRPTDRPPARRCTAACRAASPSSTSSRSDSPRFTQASSPMSVIFHPLRVRSIEPDTQEAVVVSFDVPQELREVFGFTQGQYLTLRTQIEGQDLRRSYSICAGVDDGELRVGVRKVKGGVFSNWINESLKAGDSIQVMAPQGRFFVPLDRQARRHHVGIAGGSGITPILSIMKTVLAREPRSSFTLVYGNRQLSSTMFKEEIEDLKNRYLSRLVLHHVFSDEHTEVPLNRGVMNRDKIGELLERVVPADSIDHVYVCGPFQMNDEAEAALLEAGVPEERIHIERFGVALPSTGPVDAVIHEARAGDAEKARVVIIRDGLQREIEFRKDQPSILDCASGAGLEVPFSCTSGVCGTCRAKVIEGQVRMERNFALDKNEVAAGFVLTCQAHPLTERVVLSFDER